MTEEFSRTALLLGENALQTLASKHVAIFGLGGVGGYVAEALVRSGIGRFDLIDHDKVSVSNLNRQIIATHSTVGRDKAEVMRERMLDINPGAEIAVHPCFFLPANADDFDFGGYDYVVDAVDTVTAKIELVLRSQAAGVPIISSMGTGNKLSPAMLEVADIYKTSVCPLAKVMRRELRKRGVKKLKVVYSREEPIRPVRPAEPEENIAERGAHSPENGAYSRGNREYGPENGAYSPENAGIQEKPAGGKSAGRIPGSTAFVPPAAGLLIASEVVRDLLR